MPMNKVINGILIVISTIVTYVLWSIMNETLLVTMLITGLIVLGTAIYSLLKRIISVAIKIYRRFVNENKG